MGAGAAHLKETRWKQMRPSREWLGMEPPPRSATLGSSVSSSNTRAPALRPRTTCGDSGGSTPGLPKPCTQPWGQQEPPPHLPAPAGWRCWPRTCRCRRGEAELRLRPGRLRHTGDAGCRGWHRARPRADLCTVCEATRKDMRSPGESSSPAIREPPTKMVPSTMPVVRGGGGTQDTPLLWGPAPQHPQVPPHSTTHR